MRNLISILCAYIYLKLLFHVIYLRKLTPMSSVCYVRYFWEPYISHELGYFISNGPAKIDLVSDYFTSSHEHLVEA